jgi:radical SAM superfamily enzyme YgiQ (UPF0313 family)
VAQIIILTGTMYQPETQPRIQRTLGAYRVASALKQNGYTVQVIDYIQYMSAQEIINALSKYLGEETLWVGYSSSFFGMKLSSAPSLLTRMYHSNVDNISIVYDYIRQNSNAKLVYGGAYALDHRHDSRVDYYVVGYADISSVQLTKFISGEIPALENSSILPNGSVLIDSTSYGDPKMNSLSTEWKDDSFLLQQGDPIPLEFARGCIFKCKFCNYPLLGKKKGTYIRDMNEVRDELIQLWELKGTDTFYITDDTFNDDNDKMEDFHKLFTSLPFKPKFSAFLRIDLIDKFPHQADLLLEAGLVGAFFGVESFNHKSAKVIGKGLHPDKVKKRLSWVKDKWNNKANIGVGLILGLPYDDDAYFQELHEYITSPDYPVDATSFNPLWIPNPKFGLNAYSSEFSLKPEIYGYSFDENGKWVHDSGLRYDNAVDISLYFQDLISKQYKVSDFQVVVHLSLGMELSDILSMPYDELYKKYNIPNLNKNKIDTYKRMIGAI